MKILDLLRRRMCSHEFSMDDLVMVNPGAGKDRVKWPCAKCGKVFTAHCGLDIAWKEGPIVPR